MEEECGAGVKIHEPGARRVGLCGGQCLTAARVELAQRRIVSRRPVRMSADWSV